MNPINIDISNSVRLWAIKTTKFKRNVLTMSYMLPISPKTTPSDILLPSVLLRGTQSYPSFAKLGIACDELYGATLDYNYSYVGDNLMITFTAVFVDDAAVGTDSYILDGVISLLSEVWFRPIFNQDGFFRPDEVDKCKATLIDSIRSVLNDTAAYTYQKCRELMCSNEPYGYSVSVEDVHRIDNKMLTARYYELLGRCGITFSYVGALDVHDISVRLGKKFEHHIGNEFMPLNLYKRHISDIIKTESCNMPVLQGKLSMGFDVGGVLLSGNKDYYAMLILNEIFGASPNSKLFRNVREEMGLCYYCNSNYNRYKGIMYVNVGLDCEKYEQVRGEILNQLFDIKKGNVTDDEIVFAKRSLLNSARQISDRPFSMLSFCSRRLMLDINCSIEEHMRKICDVKLNDIITIANNITPEAIYFVKSNKQAEVCSAN